MNDDITMFLIGFFGGLFFGVLLTLSWPSNAATVNHDLTTQASWAALQLTQPVKLAYGGTIAYDGGSVTIPGATVPMTVTVDLYHRYMNPGTGGLRIGSLSVEWDADHAEVCQMIREATNETLLP